jgi:hypothetical protein
MPYLLARVAPCNTRGLDAALPENPVVTFDSAQMAHTSPDIVHIDTIVAMVGRIHMGGNNWAIVDRSRGGARTQFVDEDGNIEFD